MISTIDKMPTQPKCRHPWEAEYWEKCSNLLERFVRQRKSGSPMPFEYYQQELAWFTMQYHAEHGLFKKMEMPWSASGAPTPIKGEPPEDFEHRQRAYKRKLAEVSDYNKALPDEIAYWQGLSAEYDARMEREGIQGAIAHKGA